MRTVFLITNLLFCLLFAIGGVSAEETAITLPDEVAKSQHGTSASQDKAADALLTALLAIQSMQGAFTQKQYSASGELLTQSSGRFMLLRPGFFHWDIQQPDSQLIVADPNYLWHHDIDLETVTRRPAASSGQMAPLKILGGDHASLSDDYQISVVEEDTYRLVPNAVDAGFLSLTLRIHERSLSRMDVSDALDQTITIEFFDIDTDTALTPDAFVFTPPEDADLFYYDE